MLSNIVLDYSTGFMFDSIRHYRVIKLIDKPQEVEKMDFQAIKYITAMPRK